MRHVVLSILLLCAARPAVGQADSEARLLFDEATKAFNAGLAAGPDEQAAHFRTALAAYETLARDKGIRNSALFFNIGNCYMHLGDIGNAVLNYRLAERSMPGNRELDANLQVALARRTDHIAAREKMVLGLPLGSIGRGVREWLRRLPAKLPVLMVVFTLVWVALGVKLVRRSAWLNALLIVAIVCTVVYAGGVAASARSFAGLGRGVLLDETLVARTGPSAVHEPSFEQPLHAGVEFRVLARESGWLKVELPDAARCWLPAESVGTY